MSHRDKIHQLLSEAADEILAFVKENETKYSDRWVPAAVIKNDLGLVLPAVPASNERNGGKGWLFATLVRILEDKSLIEFKKESNNRTFYRSR